PVLLLQIVEGFGVELQQAHYQVAAALEMIHTGSLIHDDLPAMDDDDYRRGRLTNHKKFDEATAILAGDSLFLDAFGLLSLADLPNQVLLELIQLLSLASGTFGMVGGQMLDMLGEGKKLEIFDLINIHSNKTGR
ncbi:polyprenyl synthetase family protein, partial [Streptococcus suis]